MNPKPSTLCPTPYTQTLNSSLEIGNPSPRNPNPQTPEQGGNDQGVHCSSDAECTGNPKPETPNPRNILPQIPSPSFQTQNPKPFYYLKLETQPLFTTLNPEPEALTLSLPQLLDPRPYQTAVPAASGVGLDTPFPPPNPTLETLSHGTCRNLTTRNLFSSSLLLSILELSDTKVYEP